MPLLTPKAQQLDKVRVDFFNEEFKRLLAQKGLRCQWTQRVQCPCSIPSSEYNLDLRAIDDTSFESGGHPDCPTCNGSGLAESVSQEVKAIVTGINTDYDSVDQGTVFLPEVKMTLLPEHLPSFGDRFTLLDSATIRQETLSMEDAVQQGAVFDVPLSYPAVTRTLELEPDNVDRTILSVFFTDADGRTVGELPETTYLYRPGDNSIRFLGGVPGANRPVKKFTVSYYANPTFTVMGQPYAIRDTFLRTKGVEVPTPMLIQAYAKLEKK